MKDKREKVIKKSIDNLRKELIKSNLDKETIDKIVDEFEISLVNIAKFNDEIIFHLEKNIRKLRVRSRLNEIR